jgi:hypothetical protein
MLVITVPLACFAIMACTRAANSSTLSSSRRVCGSRKYLQQQQQQQRQLRDISDSSRQVLASLMLPELKRHADVSICRPQWQATLKQCVGVLTTSQRARCM